MVHKIVLDLDIETTDPHAVTKYLTEWYQSGSGHQTDDGVDYEVNAVEVTYEGVVDDF